MCVIRRHFRWVQADSGGNVFFVKYGDPSGGSQQSRGKHFFAKDGGPSGGSLLLGRGIIILRIIRKHFLAATWTQLSASHHGVSQLAGRVFIFLCVIRRHFRWVQADSGGNVFFAKYAGPFGGSQLPGGKRFFHEIRWPVRWVPTVRWRNNYFARNKEALPCVCRGPSC